MQIQDLVAKTDEFQNVLEHLVPHTRQLITGLTGSARATYYASLFEQRPQPQLIVADNQLHADQLSEDLKNYLTDEQIFNFPAEDRIEVELATASPDARAARLAALNALTSGQAVVVITTLAGLRKKLTPPAIFNTAKLTFNFTAEYQFETIRPTLLMLGYEAVKMVDKPGDFAIRGSIVDIYPFGVENPVRIDFFDTEIDSMRFFDIVTQKSLANIETFTVLPVKEFILDAHTLAAGQAKLAAAMTTVRSSLTGAAKKHLTDYFTPLLADNALIRAQELNLYIDYFYPQATSLVDYLGAHGTVIFEDLAHLQDAEQQLITNDAEWVTDRLAKNQVLPQIEIANRLLDIVHHSGHAQVIVSQFQKGLGKLKLDNLVQVNSRVMQQFFGQLPLLKTEMERWQKQKYTVLILANNQDRINEVQRILADFEIKVTIVKPNEIQPQLVQVFPGQLQSGFELTTQRLAVLTENEIFASVRKKARPKRQTLANAERIKSYSELKVGDYVVHVNHGIGVYEGMQTLEVHGVHQDYVTIGYQKEAKIFIPASQLNLVQKYVGAEDKSPKISKLGGTEWAKTKHKVASQIEDIADQLLALYAEREAAKGYAFSANASAMQEFADAFAYTETPDQLRSTAEVLADMEKQRPMDRLLVGDVGFGKTEVAFRAAYKAFLDHKQVAILVPTTILAQQHFESMQARFADFGVKLGLLSRFQTPKQMAATMAGLKDHTIDIVVGTHRVLSKDVIFADIGLLIVDEEQRFGVKHKERLKELKTNVDVLTLTATPIPRTLHMSMLGVRDLSVIETPPANRYPIQTYVMEQNGGVIADAIEREMGRQGQVFYLHNRVNDIEKVTGYLNTLVPEARIAYAHGQMSENQLETVLYDFINREYDVLVATTIIETGVDIPNANTLIIENADHMGLAQLYQLRGRVGRSSRVAYAYFTYPINRTLNEESEKRLEAIRDFTELGSGFKIAMRDLSIRGAGNLLGKQQHGFIDSVGYDLYTQMLTEAVAKKRGQGQTNISDAEIDLAIEAYIPSTYIEDQGQKIEMYRRIRQATTDPQFVEVEEDLLDRFGEYPQEVINLLQISRLKALADTALVEKIWQESSFIFVQFSAHAVKVLSMETLMTSLTATKLRSVVSQGANEALKIKFVIQPNMVQTVWFTELTNYLQAMVTSQIVEEEQDGQ